MLHLVLTLIGDDRPGLVEALAATIRQHQGNWLESSLAQLAGKFAGIVNVAVPAAALPALKAALAAQPDLQIIAEVAGEQQTNPSVALNLSLTGNDRPGIVQDVAAILSRHLVNVEEFNSHTSSAPMSGDLLFHAQARLSVRADTDLAALHQALEGLSNELMVELQRQH